MTRIRINFSKSFCDEKSCNICFRDGRDKEVQTQEQVDKKIAAYAATTSITAKFKVDTTTNTVVRCPRCSGSMVVRTNRNTGQQFYGCSIFPDCRGTRPFHAEAKPTTVKEPVKEVTFNDLLSRPISKMIEEVLKTDGDLASIIEQIATTKKEEQK